MSDTPSAPTSRTHVYEVKIQFGDCDPAGIVFFPNYSRWMDEASLAFFMACGIPPWRELVKTRGIVGTPLLEIQTQFKRPSTYGETLQIHTTVEEWNAKTFRHRHIVKRGEELICEGTEVRAFVVHDPDSGRLKAIPIPEDIRQACQMPAGPTAA
jgi:4-hydroxybenzoyl-CoA thioesterase